MERYWELKRILPNEKNQNVVGEYLKNLKLTNFSKITIVNYRQLLEHFFGDMGDEFSSLAPEQILGWLQTNKGHLKKSSYKNCLSIISSFYNFCVEESLIERSPIKKRWFPRPPKAIPKFLEKGDIAKVRQMIERSSLRNQALVEFMLTSGCRVAEVHNLVYENLNIESRTAQVMGKGKKIRHVHFSEKCSLLLERYLENRQMKPHSPVFISSRTGDRLSTDGIRAVITKIGEKAGLSTRLHPHRFRHTFATELLAKGAELSFISDQLGHSQLGTTLIYANIPNYLIISQYRKFMG